MAVQIPRPFKLEVCYNSLLLHLLQIGFASTARGTCINTY
jgi:hypothetical protein